MAPGNNGRHPSHTGTIPKTKARINCNVPQEAVTPTRRDMTTNLVTTSLDWVPVSEYNTRTNYSQTRKQTNNSSDQELTDLDNSVSFESGFGRFVPVRPQPRALPLNVQNRENLTAEQHDDGASSTVSGHTLHPYAHQVQNGLIAHSNHAAAAVMIVNPTTPNAVTGNVSQPFNAISQNRNNLTRNLNPARNNFDGHSHPSNNNTTPQASNSRTRTKTVNLMNNMYDQGQGSFSNVNENNHGHRESARALGEAIVAACPDAAAVERRLSQIREYIRVTSSLVDTMRNSEDEQEDVASRPVSAHSNGSAYSDNELWQNEIKNKMEMSQMRLAALKQQQKRLLKYQEEAKQQLDEINRERQSQEQQTIQPSTSHDNFAAMQNQSFGNYNHPNRMYAANQIGVATTLPHSSEVMHAQQNMSNNMDQEQETEHGHSHSAHSTRSQEERFSHREANIANGEEAAGGARDSEVDEEEMLLNERGRLLQHKLRELKLKKEHMESLVSEFQKMQLATTLGAYSSSGDDSGNDEPSRKCNKPRGHLNNADPFKLIEIKAIKKALQKTKDLMRTAENYEEDQMGGEHEDSFRETSNHPNIHDNKSEGGGSLGDWSNEGSVWRVRNTLLQRHKFTNEQHSQQCHPQQQLQQQHPQQQQRQQLQQQHPQQQLHQQHPQQQLQQQHLQQQLQQQLHQHPQQHPQQQLQQQQHPQQQLQQQHPQQQSHEANLTSLQELAQELRLETEKIMGERARLNDMISNKEVARKQKKVNEEVRPGPSSCPGPVERRQMQLRALLADKQRELEALLNKEKVISSIAETQKIKPVSRTTSVVDQSYNSEQEEPDSRSEQVLLDSQISRETENYRGGGDSISGTRSIPVLPSHIGSAYGSDSDSASRNKSNQRNRSRRRQMQERLAEDEDIPTQSNNAAQNTRHEPRAEASNVNMVPPTAHNSENAGSMAYSHIQPPPGWTTTKSNQDMRTNQFTQNSHSQTMERLMGTPQMSYPPSMPYNMMMPYGMVGGCGCGCGFWGAWCWQQLVIQQREIHQLRDQLNHLEERWRAETASHTLNNQVPPGNRANNYWDNFRSYSRQNLLSANNKTNADGHLSGGPAHNPHPLVERSHNTLHQTSSTTSPCITPKRNTNAASFSLNAAHTSQTNNEDVPNRQTRQNVSYERSLSFSSAPDLLNVNHNPDADAVTASHSGNIDESTTANVSNININRQETPSNSFRNLNISNPIPEIIQHSNNLNSTANSKKKSSSKLPAKNSTNRRNFTLDYTQTSNINIASTSEAPNPNLASTSRQIQDKATSKLFDLLRENEIYSEVTNLIGVNESHPDFLIQLFRELQGISSDNLRQRVLQSIRNVSTPYTSLIDGEGREMIQEETRADPVSTTSTEHSNYNDCNSVATQNVSGNRIEIDNKVMRFLILNSDEICSIEFLDVLATNIISSTTGDLGRFKHSRRRINDFLAKYEGMRVCEVSSDILDNLPMLISTSETDSGHLLNVLPESTIMQDVAGSLNLFSSSDSELHQMNACDDIDLWPDHDPMDMEPSDLNDNRPESTDGKVDLLNCLEMHNGDLAEADQTRRPNMSDSNLNDHDDVGAAALPDAHDTEDVTPTEAEAEWLGLDRVPTRLHMEEASEKQKD